MLATQTPFTQTDSAYLAFVAGFKTLSNKTMRAELDRAFEVTLAENGAGAPASVAEAEEILDRTAFYRWYRFGFRLAQELMWSSVEQAVEPWREEWLARVAPRETNAVGGTLQLHPERPLPEWTLSHDIHLQPGSFHGDPLAGPIYELGARLHFLGSNDDDREQTAVAGMAPEGDHRAILDLGCGPGRSTIPYKRRFPDAEVWGIELGAPLLTYAHVRAESLGEPVHYEQMDAAALTFGDESFDIVSAHLVFHEMPTPDRLQGFREAHRVLRPGGTLIISDLPPYRNLDPMKEAVLRWQHRDAGEPFSDSYQEMDVPAALEEAGFDVTEIERGVNPERGRPNTHLYIATRR